MDIQTFLNMEEDVVIDSDGNMVEKADSIEEGTDGTLTVSATSCMVSYVDCKSKTTKIQTLRKGDTFYYGDWNGSRCVRKTYTC